MQRPANTPARSASLTALLLGVVCVAVCGVAGAAGEEEGPTSVPLDRLLRLPSAPVEARVERRGGNTKAQWQSRFANAREELEDARRALEETRAELREISGESDAWRMSAPGLGGGDPDAPLDFKLSQNLKRQREELDRAERRLQDLDVEANLAGVPEDWRHEPGWVAPEADASSATDARP